MDEDALYQELLKTETRVPHVASGALRPVTEYARLARTRSWRQRWDATARVMGPDHEVTGTVWSDAIERSLAEQGAAYIPVMDAPVYLDRPIVLRGGNRLVAHADADIRLIVGAVGTCLVRNAGIVSGGYHPVELAAGADAGIRIEGGIWSDQYNERRGQGGAYDARGTVPGARGMFLLHNVTDIAVRNVRFRDCSSFAIQLGNARDFVVEHIVMDETADGVHIEGPSSHGIVRHIAGKTNDDAVALNAWDWEGSSLTFGPITNILVEDVEVPPGLVWSELRLLPGTKTFPDGVKLDCDIRRCVYRNVRGVHTFKMYDQPNIHKPDEDFADPIGRMSDLFFADIVVAGIRAADYYDPHSDGVFDICADIEGLTIRDVRFGYRPGEGDMAPYLVSVGPKSLVWPRGPSPDDGWKEVFNPRANPVLKRLSLGTVLVPGPDGQADCQPHARPTDLVHVRTLTPDAIARRTPERGGTETGHAAHHRTPPPAGTTTGRIVGPIEVASPS
ncbi:MAG: hypothetical protein PHR35_15625 [Kiritimatiellae bacterium]|nr:hypothetical protein [Kiritimatiellia bacterium]